MAEFLQSANFKNMAGVSHGFFTRNGGVSDGLYAALNCSFGSNDDPAIVAENRQRVADALKTEAARLITPHQTHSADVVVATETWARDRALRADAIVTREKGLAIGILTADCAPVLFADEQAGIIAAAHAGWRGAIAGVLEETIDKMIAEGAKRSNIKSALGPCLHQMSYEVGPEFKQQFIQTNADYAQFFSQTDANERPHFDMPAFILHRLTTAGLRKIAYSAMCTYENESLFFSYRRNTHKKCTDYGRQISAIVLT